MGVSVGVWCRVVWCRCLCVFCLRCVFFLWTVCMSQTDRHPTNITIRYTNDAVHHLAFHFPGYRTIEYVRVW
jgi:hypothetical protein